MDIKEISKMHVPVIGQQKGTSEKLNMKKQHDAVMEAMIKTENHVIYNSLSEHLGRAADIPDLEKITQEFDPRWIDRYILIFDGLKLGMVRKRVEGRQYIVDFKAGITDFKNETDKPNAPAATN